MERSAQIQVVRPAFTGASREVDPGSCFVWLREGWAIFVGNLGVWIGSTAVLMVLLFAANLVPVFGQIAVTLLLPVFAAGIVCMCNHQQKGGQAEIADLFAGFQHNSGSLVIVGVIFATGIFGLAAIAFKVISGGAIGSVITGRLAGFGIALSAVMLASIAVFILSIPVIMATWFAPLLVFLHDMEPLPAMKASFAAGARNWLTMAVFGVMLVIALFIAMAPLLLGMAMLITVLSGATYASYQDIIATAPLLLGMLLLIPVFSGAAYASYREIFLEV
jgi:uncharacterized membrane protein